VSVFPKVEGITPLVYPLGMYAYGFTIAAWMHCVSVAPLIRFDAGVEQSVRSLTSRFGPTVPDAPASASVWHPLQPEAPVNTAFPAAAAPPVEVEVELDEPALEEPAAALATLLPEPGTPG